jgi:hypothetical protein
MVMISIVMWIDICWVRVCTAPHFDLSCHETAPCLVPCTCCQKFPMLTAPCLVPCTCCQKFPMLTAPSTSLTPSLPTSLPPSLPVPLLHSLLWVDVEQVCISCTAAGDYLIP